MPKTTVITGGTIVTDYGEFRADLIMKGEEIAGIVSDASDIDHADQIDATGLLVMPGGIDPHTHFREPEEFTKEGFATGGAGAAAGGITTVVEMPQADPTTVTAEQLHAKVEQVGKTAIVDMALWGGIVGEPLQAPDEIAAMAEAGATAFKSFLASTSPSFPAVSDDQLLSAMRAVAETGLPYGLHAENDGMVRAGIERVRKQGRTEPLAHADSVPPIVEAAAVNTALLFAQETSDYICSDHCGFTAEQKQAGDANIFNAPNGITGIQTLFPVFYNAAVNGRGMERTQFVRQMATNAAQMFGL